LDVPRLRNRPFDLDGDVLLDRLGGCARKACPDDDDGDREFREEIDREALKCRTARKDNGERRHQDGDRVLERALDHPPSPLAALRDFDAAPCFAEAGLLAVLPALVDFFLPFGFSRSAASAEIGAAGSASCPLASTPAGSLATSCAAGAPSSAVTPSSSAGFGSAKPRGSSGSIVGGRISTRFPSVTSSRPKSTT